MAIINLFQQYSKTDKDTDTLSKEELKELLEKEFRPILKVKIFALKNVVLGIH